MLTAVITGLLALLGALIGAWLSRRSEYEKWFRQEKAAALADYLRQLHDTRHEAREAYYGSADGDELSRSIAAGEAFARLDKYTALARLYISAEGREMLSYLQDKLWINCTVRGGPANKSNEVKVLMSKIQVLLESELGRIPGRLKWPL